MNPAKNTVRQLKREIIVIVLLLIGLVVTTFALTQTVKVQIEQNEFQTGKIKLEVNGGKPIIEAREFKFEPGMTVTKNFCLKNTGTGDAYYKVYFTDVKGGLATVLQVTISDGDEQLYQGTADQLTRDNVAVANNPLTTTNNERTLTISFYYPEEAGNMTQNCMLEFNLCAEGVQTKNNTNKQFEYEEEQQGNEKNT